MLLTLLDRHLGIGLRGRVSYDYFISVSSTFRYTTLSAGLPTLSVPYLTSEINVSNIKPYRKFFLSSPPRLLTSMHPHLKPPISQPQEQSNPNPSHPPKPTIPLPTSTLTSRNRARPIVPKPLLRVAHMHRMPTSSTNTNKILHQHPPPLSLAIILYLPTPLHRRRIGVLPAFGMRIRHPEPEHTDDAARQMFPAF